MKKLFALSATTLLALPALATDELEIPDVSQLPTTKSAVYTLSGDVLNETCSIVGGDKALEFPKALTSDIKNGVETKVDFTVQLERCPSINKLVSLHFTPSEEQAEDNLLKNTYGGDKASVKVKISSGEQQILLSNPKGEQNVPSVNAQSETVQYNFSASYVKDGEDVSAGGVLATLPFTVIYK
ncbi:MAG: fimbrial protein [Pasteurellaceae bacterium]|nr:fimbrial protein [Pasteurellaceae bacterium]